MVDDEAADESSAFAALVPRMTRLLRRLEEDAYADARPCSFCDAPDDADVISETRLPHAPGCELDLMLRAAGLRSGTGAEDEDNDKDNDNVVIGSGLTPLRASCG